MRFNLRRLITPGILAATVLAFGSTAAALGQYASGSTGVDLGWPNCSATAPRATFGIVGVTGGTGYTTNPCMANEAAHFVNLSLYANTGWNNQSTYINPTSPLSCASGDESCLAYNYGYNAGLYAYDAAAGAGVNSQTWWLDVETENTWSSQSMANRSSLQGEYDALSARGVTTIGAYSTTAQWNTITDSWQNNWPSWGATTWTTANQAKKYCSGHQFTGGPSYLMQYQAHRSSLDQNVAC